MVCSAARSGGGVCGAVVASSGRSTRLCEVSTAQTGSNHEHQLRRSLASRWPGHADGIALSAELTTPGP
jgi:hypothetical protein